MDLKQACSEIGRRFQAMQGTPDAGAYETFAASLAAFDASLRERFQDLTQAEVTKVAKVLRSNDPLTAEQLALLRSWMVGDAESYAKAENNVPDWRAEMQRLVAAIEDAGRGPANVEALLRLRGLLRDAIRTAQDLHHVVEQQERIARFEEATKELDREERELLITMLSHKVKSSAH